ncbi:glycosyltransferase [Bythopirellula polymerisocia]|uniref:Putative glycosyl transferase n=1 Tax=Bythopirellula polymerisocia TaxID=2528003 RepID=A0A5C6CUB4_9BACT|nr:glycosyltransferase [Bythopirellula polymerisocia]TWU28553.1 putative glycosyl transferase [Bythopirellula polymerisocia]
MLKEQLTVVLPMHNCERVIRSSVHKILEFSVHAKLSLDLVIVDDGSTDDTFETACELACRFPQVKVLRQPFRSGLAAVLDLVRNRLSLEMVVLHDGVSPISSLELRNLLLDEQGNPRLVNASEAQTQSGLDSHGSRRFSAVRALQNTMERAHRQVVGFSWLHLEKPLVPRRRHQTTDQVRPTPCAGATGLPLADCLAGIPSGFSSLPMLP